MAETAQTPKREGWGVATRGALLLMGGFLACLGLVIGIATVVYRIGTNHPHADIPRNFPAPQLETYERLPQGRLPRPDIGPPEPTAAQAQAISAAMQTLAERGDAGWAPLQKAPAS